MGQSCDKKPIHKFNDIMQLKYHWKLMKRAYSGSLMLLMWDLMLTILGEIVSQIFVSAITTVCKSDHIHVCAIKSEF